MLSKQHNLPPIKITFNQLACVAFKRGVEGNLGVSLPREEVGGRSRPIFFRGTPIFFLDVFRGKCNFKQFSGVRRKRVWKGIFGIRDLAKIRCGNRENDKYIDGIGDLTVPREAGLAKNWVRDAGFMFSCLSGMPETVTTLRF